MNNIKNNQDPSQAINNSSSKIKTINQIILDHILPALFFIVFSLLIIGNVTKSFASKEYFLTLRYILSFIISAITGILFLIRRPIISQRAKPLESIVAFIGTFSVAIFAFLPVRTISPSLIIIGDIFLVMGLVWTIISILALGRCFGILPEVRGLVTRGPYRIVRHPLYLGEMIAGLGNLLPVISLLGVLIFVFCTGIQIWRTYNEERALLNVFPSYVDYVRNTHRIIPFIL